MTDATRPGWLRRLRAADPTPDGELLRRFHARSDPDAFELLVRRHAPAVLRVCRAVARDPHAAEDAAQAVFLVLARKAGTLAGVRSLPAWLARVAYRAANRARARTEAHRYTSLDAVAVIAGREPDPAAVAEAADLAAVVLDAVHRLPGRYHAPVILCYLHGLTNAEAARQLGWPVGTVAGRLARAREVLRARLAGHDLAVPAALTALLGAPAAVPAAFTPAVVRAAAGHASPALAQLTHEVIRSMTATTRRLTAATAALFLGLATAAVGAGVHVADDRPPPAEKTPPDPPKAEAAGNELVVFGTVTNEDDKTPMPGVEVWAAAGMGTLRTTGKTTSDRDGRFRLTFTPGIHVAGHKVGGVAVVSVRKPGWTGAAWAGPAQFQLTDTPLSREEIRKSAYRNITPGAPYELKFFMRPAASLRVNLLGADGKPMAGARVWLTGDRLPPGAGVIADGRTDAAGAFTIKEVPRDDFRLVLGGPGDSRRELLLGHISFKDAAEYVANVAVYDWTDTSTHVKFKVTRGGDLKP